VVLVATGHPEMSSVGRPVMPSTGGASADSLINDVIFTAVAVRVSLVADVFFAVAGSGLLTVEVPAGGAVRVISPESVTSVRPGVLVVTSRSGLSSAGDASADSLIVDVVFTADAVRVSLIKDVLSTVAEGGFLTAEVSAGIPLIVGVVFTADAARVSLIEGVLFAAAEGGFLAAVVSAEIPPRSLFLAEDFALIFFHSLSARPLVSLGAESIVSPPVGGRAVSRVGGKTSRASG
jgi:hypothetical protein